MFITTLERLYRDPLGDTLRAANTVSAQRTLSIIQKTFGIKGHAVSKLFKVEKDGVTFGTISKKEFNAAIKGLDKEGKALARGYYQAVNSKATHTVEVVKRGEKLSEPSLSSLQSQHDNVSKTGIDIDKNHGGGHTGNNFYDGNLVKVPEGAHVIVVEDAASKISDYSDGIARASLPGEILAHELIGHGLGSRAMLSDGKDEAIQAGNLYLQHMGYSYYRTSHGLTPNDPNTNPQGIPKFLAEQDPFNPFEDK